MVTACLENTFILLFKHLRKNIVKNQRQKIITMYYRVNNHEEIKSMTRMAQRLGGGNGGEAFIWDTSQNISIEGIF